MKARLTALLICCAVASSLRAQTTIAPGEGLILTGITDLSSYKRAFFRVESPGSAPQTCTLAEGQKLDDITLLVIDSQKAKVTVRYRGHVSELSLNNRISGQTTPTKAEQQRDTSHTMHHRLRAQVDREQDQRHASDETPAKEDNVRQVKRESVPL